MICIICLGTFFALLCSAETDLNDACQTVMVTCMDKEAFSCIFILATLLEFMIKLSEFCSRMKIQHKDSIMLYLRYDIDTMHAG